MSARNPPAYCATRVCNELRPGGPLCDAVLHVQGVAFQVHRVLLCDLTPYFRVLFTWQSDADRRVFTIPGLSPEMMQLILQFAYTHDVSVTEQNVQELTLAADQLNIMGVLEICSSFLLERLCPDNCVGLWQFTSVVMLPGLREAAYGCVLRHFEEVVAGEEFLQLTARELTDILGRDELNVRQESVVYKGLIRWISCVPAERQEHTFTLLSKVRLTLLSPEYIRSNVLSCSLVTDSDECQELVKSALEAIRRFPECRAHPSSSNPLFRPRLPDSVLLATGGWDRRGPTNRIEAYNCRTDSWVPVPNTEPPLVYHGAAFLGGVVYLVGGFNGRRYLSTVRRFDPVRKEWGEVGPMHVRRGHISVTVLDGCIYALGGRDWMGYLSTAEVYRPHTNQWSLIAPMHVQRSDAGCATLNNKVYICGGLMESDWLRTAECYDPAANQWTLISGMNSCRSGVGVVALADQIFAVGGYDGNNYLQCAEAYNPRTNAWHYVSSMKSPRCNFGIGVLDGRLFVVGGFNGTATTQDSECYDATLDEWKEICNMAVSRNGLQCCVISGLSQTFSFNTAAQIMF